MKKQLLFYLFLYLPFLAGGQLVQDAFTDPFEIDYTDANKVFLGMQNQNLFRNNEFFNGIEAGFTTFGSLLNASLKYYPFEKMRLEGGIHLLKYYGSDGFERVEPIIRIQYNPIPELQFVMGNLFGGHNHGFLEPLYRFERFMEVFPETGLQVLYNSNILKSDLYIDWTNYIFRDSYTENESFNLGWSSEIRLTKPGNAFQISVPVQILTTHYGGQTDTINLPEQWIGNLAGGISVRYRFPGFINEVGAEFYYLGYNFIRGNEPPVPEKGHARYPLLYIRTRWVDAYLGHWDALNFYAPLGEPVFSSVSRKDETIIFPVRKLFIMKIDIHHEIAEGIHIGARLENYYDYTGSGRTKNTSCNDYSYAVYINFRRDFFLKQLTRYP